MTAHQKMAPKGRSLAVPDLSQKVKKSAVLILLYPENGELQICLTKRNDLLKHHPGQISFPGGRCEKHETDPMLTALRETEEEIGVPQKEVQVLGKLSTLYIPVSNFIIHPYIGWIATKPTFSINTSEVDKVITLPLFLFLDEDSQKKMPVETSIGPFEVPCYFISGQLIWGATSMIIAELEAILRQHRGHRVKHSDNADNDQALQ